MDSDFDDQLSSLLGAAGEAGYVLDIMDGRIQWFGNAAEVLGVEDLDEISTYEAYSNLVNPQDLPDKLQSQTYTDQEIGMHGQAYECEYRIRLGDGQQVWIQDRGTAYVDQNRHILKGLIRRTGEEQNCKKTLERLAFYDDMTGFHNRINLQHLLERAVRATEIASTEGTFVSVGIDRLSLFNEAFGSEIADEVIKGVAQRLDSLIGPQGTLGRIAGDVFGIILPDTNEHGVAALATKILSSLCTTPLETTAGPLRVSVSMGGVSFPNGGIEAIDLITKSESALQQAKEQGRGCYIPYKVSEGQREEYKDWLRTGDNFLLALDGNRLVLAFQPVINAKSGEVAFHECLVRMIGPNGMIMEAGEFIPAVERLGLARLVDQYTIKLAIDELVAYSELSLSVNVSAWTLTDPCWLRRLISLLRQTPEVADRLIIEITETMAMKDLDEAARFVRTLQDLGCRVALDDFGAGNTSFSQIKKLNVDIIKIDKSFIRNAGEDEGSQLFIKALQDLADGFNLETVAEGAETMADVGLLQDDGVTFIQGFVYGYPSVERVWLPKEHAERTAERGASFISSGSDSIN